MRHVTRTLLLSLVFTSYVSYADWDCTDGTDKDIKPSVEKAEALEKSGKLEEAFALTRDADPSCAPTYGPRAKALNARTAKTIATQAEAKKNYEKAAQYFYYLGSKPDQARVWMKQAKEFSTDLNKVSKARYFFHYENDSAGLAQVNAIIAQTIKSIEKKEQAAFSKSQRSIDELQQIGSWHHLMTGESLAPNAQKIAIMRGDTLRKLSPVAMKERAMEYYQLAESQSHISALKKEAQQLASAELKKGNKALASRYYQLAGEDDKADDLARQAEEVDEEAEEARKKEFEKSSDDLEKELGF